MYRGTLNMGKHESLQSQIIDQGLKAHVSTSIFTFRLNVRFEAVRDSNLVKAQREQDSVYFMPMHPKQGSTFKNYQHQQLEP